MRSVRLDPGGVQISADLLDRRLPPAERAGVLVEAEELDARVVDRREVLEDLLEPAGKRNERPEVGRVVGEVGPAEEAHRRGRVVRDAEAPGRVANRELLDAQRPRRDQRVLPDGRAV